ncbi:aminotransferase class I/II-fold pyridoxal phosphate-dependent enzyme [Paraburkholderia megapolitana]|uniref:8-amino-7-oxononanoate synthase n=1 Tax=Paraburkholderia megapolitana TaxID=420953 RepID=A0A1I3VUD2_9BURK|nr:aminotransferase class I/II-fold pyridoxal phosphate-dependent enzyme [Paraburkholderia megapolitana]QDQ84654.1 aminotransferase class I/II-fold pyridoxal phosphate-dependent enzyme [Paraburkholderia megapolitana]SFJ97876.1 8-amino-7-oxononanoate synthase [Paraburkholderia megapolitana]
MNPLSSALQSHAVQRPDQYAFRFLGDGENETDALTWSTLHHGEMQLAWHLQQICAVDDRVVLMLPQGPNFVLAMAACLRSGVIVVPTNSPRPGGRGWDTVQNIIADCAPRLILANASQTDAIERALRAEGRHSSVAVLAIETLLSSHEQADPRGGATLALLQYTSGSTGNPKGVMVGVDNLADNLETIRLRFDCSEHAQGIIWLPPYHDMGLLGGVLQPFHSGVPVVILPPVAVIQQPKRWLRAISKYRGTISGGPNFIYEQCAERIGEADSESLDLSSWKNAFCGAEPVRAEILERFAERFSTCGFARRALYPCYGLAESTLFVAGTRASGDGMLVNHFDSQDLGVDKAVSCEKSEHTIALVGHGVPADNQEVVICDPVSRRQLTAGEIGEIWIKGPSVARGYWNNPVATETTFQARTASGAGPYMRTGDLGFYLDETLYLSARLKDLLIIRGRNHYPQDIEDTSCASDEALLSGGTAAVSDGDALIVLQEVRREFIAKVDVDTVLRKIRLDIAKRHDIGVEKIVLVKPGTLLRTSSGKIRRAAILDAYRAGNLPAIHEWQALRDDTADDLPEVVTLPQDGVDEWVRRWIEKKAGDTLAATSAEVRLDELGLDSLQQATLVADLSTLIGAPVPVDMFARHTQLQGFLDEANAVYRFAAGYKSLDPSMRERLYQQLGETRPALQFEDVATIPAEYYDIDRLSGIADIDARSRQLESIGSPFFTTHEGINGAQMTMGEKAYLNFSNHNYLGLSGHPDVVSAAKAAVDQYGTSVSAARIVAGQRTVHVELERQIAALTGHEDALTFVSSNFCNVTVVGHLMEQDDLILYDEYSHDSLLQGAKLSGAAMRAFPHNDWNDVDQFLSAARGKYRKVMIFIEGAYSMDGDIPELARFIEVKLRHKALLMVDECLSIGVVGKTGRGICEYAGVDPTLIDITMGGISKSFASCGGYIAGSRSFINYLRYTTPGFVYTTGMPPANAAAARAAIATALNEPWRVEEVQQLARHFLDKARSLGLDTGPSKDTPVIPVVIGDQSRCVNVYHKLLQHHINVQPILYPAVPENKSRLRFFVNYGHTRQDIDKALELVKEFM